VNILLLAPNPFYEDRGTPIAVDLLLRALSERGDRVRVLTYHLGADRAYPGVSIRRIPRVPLVRTIRPGLSWKKIVCDVFLAARAFGVARREKWDVAHAVEESVFIALVLRKTLGLPYVYDMDSSLPQQIVEARPGLRFLMPVMKRMETAAIRGAAAVVTMCDALTRAAVEAGARRAVTLRDVSLLSLYPAERRQGAAPERGKDGLTFLYVGNLEPYQGIDLLLQAFAVLRGSVPDAGLVIAGGDPASVSRYRRRAEELGLAPRVRFLGPWPLSRMAELFASADVLVSPRIRGTNTPMKIYSYMDSGKPVVATRLPTHTQVLTDEMAVLEAPDPDSLARGMFQLARDPALRRRLAERAGAVAREQHSFEAFRNTVHSLYAELDRLLLR
jgi:glycosyltransferase involved in cell wall biosynthesis